MNKYLLNSLLVISIIGLTACSGKPYTAIDDPTNAQLLEGKKPLGSKKKANTQPQVIYISSPQSAPVQWQEGALTFDEWKKAKEENSQDYKDFVEYQEYLKFLEQQKK